MERAAHDVSDADVLCDESIRKKLGVYPVGAGVVWPDRNDFENRCARRIRRGLDDLGASITREENDGKQRSFVCKHPAPFSEYERMTDFIWARKQKMRICNVPIRSAFEQIERSIPLRAMCCPDPEPVLRSSGHRPGICPL